MANEEHFAAVWDEYRRRRRQCYGTFFGGLFTIMAVAKLGDMLHIYAITFVGLAAGPVWLVASAVVWFRFSGFYCPRCDRPFFSRYYNNPFARKCAYCGLPKWATKSSPSSATVENDCQSVQPG